MRPVVQSYRVPVRWAAPQAIAVARGLGQLLGRDIKGERGTIRYGWPSIQTQRTAYKGYVFPPQVFTGYDPRKVAAGFIRPDPASLPGDYSVASEQRSPLEAAMANITLTQQIGMG